MNATQLRLYIKCFLKCYAFNEWQKMLRRIIKGDGDLPGPRVNAGDLEAVVPAAGVGALALGAGADAVSMGLAVLPATAVGATIVEVEATAVDLRATRWRRGRTRGARTGR